MLSGILWLPEDQPRSRQYDAEKLAAAALHKHLRRRRATLREHLFEEAHAYLIERLWEASHEWDPQYGLAFSTWATRHKLPYWIIEWYRRTFYDARDQSTDPSRSSVDARRELAFPSSIHALNPDEPEPTFIAPELEPGELEYVVGALTGDLESGGPGTLAGILSARDRGDPRDLVLVNQRRNRAAA